MIAKESWIRRVVLFLFPALTACVPFPHMRTVTPPQEGLLLRGGSPAAGVTVYQSFSYWDKNCEHIERQTVTDASGHFSFPLRRDFFLFIGMGDDYYYSFICADDRGVRKWLTFSSIVHESSESPTRYTCDLATRIQSEFPAEKRKDLPALRCK